LKFRNLRLPLRHPNLLPFPNQHSKQPRLLRLPIGSPRPQQTLRRALLLDCRLRYPNPLHLLHGSTERSHRKQMKLPYRRLHRRPHLLLHRRFRRSPMPNYWKRRSRQRLRPASRLAAALPRWPRSLPWAWGARGFSREWRTPGANRDRGGAATGPRSAGPTTGTLEHGH